MEIEKTITNIEGFSEIVLNNKTVKQAPKTTLQTVQNGSKTYFGSSDPQSSKVTGVKLNNVLYPFEDTDTLDLVTALRDVVTEIQRLIPEQATPANKMADKNFVNSSIATNTASLITDDGEPFQSVEDLEAYSGTLTNNDYAFVVRTDEAGNTFYDRYKYNGSTLSWQFEYTLNNSSFTASQWNTINSGLTSEVITRLDAIEATLQSEVTQVVNIDEVTTTTPVKNTVYLLSDASASLTLGNMSTSGRRIMIIGNVDASVDVSYNDFEGNSVTVSVNGGSSITLYSTPDGYADRHYGAVWN